MNNSIETLFAKAYRHQHDGQLPQAIRLYEQLLVLDPIHKDSLHFLGLAYAQLNDMGNALIHLKQALKESSDDPSLLNNMANVYKKTHQLDEAIVYYLKALELQPDYAQAHHNLATVYALQNKYQQALLHYKKAIHAVPDFSMAHFNLGLLLLNHDELNAAKIQFNNVLSLRPDHLEAQFYLGLLYLKDNFLDEADRAFKAILTQNPEQVEALTNLGVIALKKEEKQQAVDYFSKALALDNEHLEARDNLAAAFMHYDRFENALMHYDVLLQKEPKNLEYLYNSGVAQMALGHLDKAIGYFERMLAIQSQHGDALNNLAAIYIRREQKDKAKDYLERALAVNPQDKISRHMLHALIGQTKAATTPEYASNLFNNYAINYDQHMQAVLHYSIPQGIGRMLHQLNLTHSNQSLDLGCGTGLTGVVLREISKHLTGVDIAKKMLNQAREKGIYDHLIQSDLVDFLQKDKKKYDLIVSADVLPYFGDLSQVFLEIKSHLTANGYFIFTTEISVSEAWRLEISARFSHHEGYIQTLIEENKLKLVAQKKTAARLQNQKPLDVMLYVLK